MFNYFKKFIDGLKNSRFIYQDEAKEAGPVEAPEEGAPETEPETKGAAAEQAEVDLSKTLDESESMRKAREHEGEELKEKPLKLGKRDEDRFEPHGIDPIGGKLRPMGKEEKPEVAEAAAEEPDVILDKAKELAATQEAEAELAALGVTEKPERPAEPLGSKEELAALVGGTVESAETELAYLAEQLKEADENKVRTWVAYAKRFAEGLASLVPGTTIDNVANDLGKELNSSDISILSAVTKTLDVKPGQNEKEIAEAIVGALKNQIDDEGVKAAFDKQLDLVYEV